MSAKSILQQIFPESANNDYKGSKIAKHVFLLITIVSIIRSCIHIFALDGGAMSIASIDISVEAGQNIVSMFALWGLSQLLLSIVFLIIYIRYKSLIPLGYLLILIEYTGRLLIGFTKPLITESVPPGAIGNYIIIPIAFIMLILSIKKQNYPRD